MFKHYDSQFVFDEDEVSRRKRRKVRKKKKNQKETENHVIKICQTNVESVCHAKI